MTGPPKSTETSPRPLWEWRTNRSGTRIFTVSERNRIKILARGAEIVGSYDTAVTLRQVFYRLVAAGLLPNTAPAYKWLSKWSSKVRRTGEFPELVDRTRSIHRYTSWASPDKALYRAWQTYRRDRTEGQEHAIYIGVEKATMVAQLMAWFTEPYGVPVLALGGYASQSYEQAVIQHVTDDGRPAVLLYAGDFDPSGEDIDRDFVERTDCFDEVVRVALLPEHTERFDLPEAMGKDDDSRSRSFEERHGRLVQVELEALDPDDLRALYQQAFDWFWNPSALEAVMGQERADRQALYDLYWNALNADDGDDDDEEDGDDDDED